jgi:biotin transport system substrate-specific component
MLLGLVGLPIFASGGGVGSILEPSFGFVIGLVLGALVTGTIVGHKRSTLALAAASAAGMLCLYLCGTVYFLIIEGVYLAQPVGLTEALCICIFPFILPDALKIALSIILYKKLTAHIKIQPTDRT